MTPEEINALVANQRAYFNSGATLDMAGRLRALRELRAAIVTYQDVIAAALQKDLGKSATESAMCEIGMVKSALNHMLRHANRYAKTKHVRTPLAQMPARSMRKPAPFGVVLVMSPWNYPFLLTMEPLIEALAAGNTVVVKPSAYSPHTSALLEKLLRQYYCANIVADCSRGNACRSIWAHRIRKARAAGYVCRFSIVEHFDTPLNRQCVPSHRVNRLTACYADFSVGKVRGLGYEPSIHIAPPSTYYPSVRSKLFHIGEACFHSNRTNGTFDSSAIFGVKHGAGKIGIVGVEQRPYCGSGVDLFINDIDHVHPPFLGNSLPNVYGNIWWHHISCRGRR